MVKKNSKRCSQPEREDRAATRATTFEPLAGLEIRYPDTAILLLRSPERPILLAAASALAKFGAKARGNLDALFDLKIVDSVLELIRHEDLFTRRFALKLLALMSAVPNVQVHLLETDTYIVFFTDMLTGDSDGFLLEFSSRILAELSSDPLGKVMYLCKYKDVSFLFERMREATDPDIKKNCIEIIDNLLKDLSGMEVITKSKEFTFAAIFEMFNQPYPIVQELALDVIEQLVMCSRNGELQENFRQSEGLQKLLDLLNHEEWNDLHCKVLHILDLSCANAATADFMNNTDGTKRLYGFMENTGDDKLKFETLKILVSLAECTSGKKCNISLIPKCQTRTHLSNYKVLHFLGLVDHLFKYFEFPVTCEVQAVVCRGIAKMTDHALAANDITAKNPINYVINLLSRSDATWLEKHAAAYTLTKLFNADYKNCTNFLDVNGQVHLTNLIEMSAKDMACETLVAAIQAISAMANYSTLAEDLSHIDLFSALSAPFEPENEAPDELKIACCVALARFPSASEEARRALIHANVPQRLYHLILDTQLVPVRVAALNLLLQFSLYPSLACLCIQEGYLFYMLKKRAASRVIPLWDACIDALYSADLPIKFAYTGRVSINDITKDGFYAMRRMSCPFPALEELFRLKLCPIETIYVVNFCDEQDDEEVVILADKKAAFEAARKTLRRESLDKGMRVSEDTIDAWLELKFGKLQIDRDLVNYLKIFTAELAVAEQDDHLSTSSSGLVDVPQIASRARLLGQFVARQLSGPGPGMRCCVEQQMELHLRALRKSVGTSVIPLGLLRVGGYIERAILFKVLADRIGLPAGLVRGEYGTSWIEIAVPVLKKPASGNCGVQSKRNIKLPRMYLCENFIVDLMKEPGNLIPMNSPQAQRYRHKDKSTCEFACCCGEA